MAVVERDTAMERFVNMLKVAVTNMQFFSSGRQSAIENVNRAHASLLEYLAHHSDASLSTREGQVWSNRTLLVAIKGFAEIMMAHEVRTIKFGRATTAQELI